MDFADDLRFADVDEPLVRDVLSEYGELTRKKHADVSAKG